MKKNIRAVMMVAAIAIIAGVNVFNSQKTIAMSDMALANVEALADDESTGSCKGYGFVLCTYNQYWVEYQN